MRASDECLRRLQNRVSQVNKQVRCLCFRCHFQFRFRASRLGLQHVPQKQLFSPRGRLHLWHAATSPPPVSPQSGHPIGSACLDQWRQADRRWPASDCRRRGQLCRPRRYRLPPRVRGASPPRRSPKRCRCGYHWPCRITIPRSRSDTDRLGRARSTCAFNKTASH